MSDDVSIADSLPPPRDDEPADLRSDIMDELNDHLDCAARQEMLRGQDEADARRIAVERFGDIPTIARQIWWEAMKEQIMKGRIKFILGATAVVLVILFCAFTLMAMFEVVQNLTYAQAAQPSFVTAAPAVNFEWGSLTVELLDEHSEPMADQPVTISGLMYRVDKAMSRDMVTDEDGRVVLDPIRAGTEYGIQWKSPSMWRYNGSVLLEPGHDKVLVIHDRPALSEAPVVFEFEWPKEWAGQDVQVCYPIVMTPFKPSNEESWYSPKWSIVAENGSLDNLSLGINRLATGETVSLPAGIYYLHDAVARSDDWGAGLGRRSKGIRFGYRELTIEIKPRGVNHINLPLPPGMVDISVAARPDDTASVPDGLSRPVTTPE